MSLYILPVNGQLILLYVLTEGNQLFGNVSSTGAVRNCC